MARSEDRFYAPMAVALEDEQPLIAKKYEDGENSFDTSRSLTPPERFAAFSALATYISSVREERGFGHVAQLQPHLTLLRKLCAADSARVPHRPKRTAPVPASQDSQDSQSSTESTEPASCAMEHLVKKSRKGRAYSSE